MSELLGDWSTGIVTMFPPMGCGCGESDGTTAMQTKDWSLESAIVNGIMDGDGDAQVAAGVT